MRLRVLKPWRMGGTMRLRDPQTMGEWREYAPQGPQTMEEERNMRLRDPLPKGEIEEYAPQGPSS